MHVVAGLSGVHFEKAFGAPGALKTSEYLLLAGPVGKYILQGAFHAEQEEVVFRCAIPLSLVSTKLVAKTMSISYLCC